MAKKRRRSNGEGTIYQVDGKWISQITYYDSNGELKRPKRTSDKHADALVRLDELRKEAQQLDMDTQHHTVKSYLESWLGDEGTTELSTSTYISYRNIIKNHIVPNLGRVKLSGLKAAKIRGMISNLQKNSVGSRSVELSYVVLNIALNQAYKDDIIIKNPCLSIKKPTHVSEECIPFTAEERKLIFDEAAGDYFEPLYKVMLSTGIRTTEMAGLEWRDIDYETNTIHVKRKFMHRQIEQLKSKHSRRTVDITPGVKNALEKQRETQKARKHNVDYVFCGERGARIDNTTFGRRFWTPLLERAGVEKRGLHHLRHTFATELLGNNVPVHVVSRLLGHSSPTITYNIYAHVIPEQKSQAAEKIQDIFG